MRIVTTRKARGTLAIVLMAVGLVGAHAQSSSSMSGSSHSGATVKPPEVPLGSGGTAALPNLDLQVAGKTGGSASSGMMGMEMPMKGMEMGMMGMQMGMNSMAGVGGGSGMAMPGMGDVGAPDNALSQQLLSTNTLLTQLLSTLASQPGGIQAAQLQTINQLLANQAALLQLMLLQSGAAPTSGSMPAGGMGGMRGSRARAG